MVRNWEILKTDFSRLVYRKIWVLGYRKILNLGYRKIFNLGEEMELEPDDVQWLYYFPQILISTTHKSASFPLSKLPLFIPSIFAGFEVIVAISCLSLIDLL